MQNEIIKKHGLHVLQSIQSIIASKPSLNNMIQIILKMVYTLLMALVSGLFMMALLSPVPM